MAAKLVLVVCVLLALASAQQKLPGLNVDIKGTTVSGLSAGGFFAVQMHVAYSDTIRGAAIFAGGPYHCAQGKSSVGTSTCMTANPPLKPAWYIANTTQFYANKQIDNPDNLKTHKVYMFSGTLDVLVVPKVMDALYTYYSHFMPKESIHYENKFRATHTMPTDDKTVKLSCLLMLPPFIGNCSYDGAGIAFKKMYGAMTPRNGSAQGALIKYDQAEFLPNPKSKGLDTTGFVYIPKQCSAPTLQRCKLHVSFHGCTQNAGTIGDVYARTAGYNRWADTNNIVVLYPQVAGHNGCYDWFAYNEAAYDLKSGSQMKAIYGMIQRIGSGIKLDE